LVADHTIVDGRDTDLTLGFTRIANFGHLVLVVANIGAPVDADITK
jgi:hypothetical protein